MAELARDVSYQFARFELRPRERLLLDEGRPMVVTSRAFDLLVTLVERAGKLVTKDELLKRVWANLVVEESNLQVQVSALRKIVGHDAIATVAGHGYRFTRAVDVVATDGARPPQRCPESLPRPATAFVGREPELRECGRLLASVRLLTLVGVGGIGKTRLSIEVAAAASADFADGVVFVDLAPVQNPRMVVDAVASSLNVESKPDRLLLDALLKAIAPRTLLVILDNCEHVLAACAEIATQLVGCGAGTRLIATSREPLHAAGEVLYQVPPLRTPGANETSPDALAKCAAVKLFADRATALVGKFIITADNGPDVARICRDLDGIPLALELAAVRVRTMPLKAIADHLDERFRLLAGNRVAVPRHKTLRALLDWSYDLLSEPERALLRRLSVFSGGFMLDAAQAVAAGDDLHAEDVLYLLSNLVDKSLVAFDVGGDRYRQLDTVRHYALERLLESGEEAATRDRHLAFHASLAQWAQGLLNGPGQKGCVDRLDDDRQNILSAFAHASRTRDGVDTALAMVYDLSMWMQYKEVRTFTRIALDVLAHPAAQEASAARCRALAVTSLMTFFTGDYEAALALAKSGVDCARACGDALGLAESLYSLGTAETGVGRQHDAHEHFLEGRATAHRMGHRVLAANFSGGLGELYSQQGRFDLAEPEYLDALERCRGDALVMAVPLNNLARNALAIRDERKALRFLRECASSRPWDSPLREWQFLMNCGGAAGLCGEWAATLRWTGVALSIQEREGIKGDAVDAPFYASQVQKATEVVGTRAAEAALRAASAENVKAIVEEAVAWLEAQATAPVAATDTTPANS